MDNPTGKRLARANRSMPPGSIIPELAYDNVLEAASWLCGAFGFHERLRIGAHRVQLVHGGGSIVVVKRGGPAAAAKDVRTHAVMVCVDDVDEHFQRVRARGGHILSEPETHAFGERQYSVQDPGGHVWIFTQSVADVDPAEWGGQLMSAGE